MPEPTYGTKELRLGVVLYGGVSLAIYMNGVTTELWHAVRASRLSPKDLSTTEKSYRALLDEVAKESGAEIAVVVDTIAGASAGGVNGVVLGHALANGSDASVLNRVWVEEAGIEKLRREIQKPLPGWLRWGGWYAAKGLARWLFKAKIPDEVREKAFWGCNVMAETLRDKTGRTTPLSGDYFTSMIAKSLADMRRKQGAPLIGGRNVLDLFLTQTDIHGWDRHLPVSGKYHPKVLTEATHGNVVHFRLAGAHSNFADEYALTFAARGTASFPIAFAAINTLDLEKGFKKAYNHPPAVNVPEFNRRYLAEHVLSGRNANLAWMADGGFLDNRPFSYVTKAIEGKVAEHEVTRAVVYVDPEPDGPLAEQPKDPPSIGKLGPLIFGLFRHEPILEDLLRLTDRNAKVERIKQMHDAEIARVDAIIEKLGATLPPPDTARPDLSHLPQWRHEVSKYLLSRAATGYAGYVQLRSRRAAETLAEILCRAFNFPWHTQHAYLLREMVRSKLADAMKVPVFRANLPPQGLAAPAAAASDAKSGTYDIDGPQQTLLDVFDISYRIRRLRHIVRTVNGFYAKLPPGADGIELRRILDRVKAALARVADEYQNAVNHDGKVRDLVWQVFAARLGTADEATTIARIEADMSFIEFDPEKVVDIYKDGLAAAEAALEGHFKQLAAEQDAALDRALLWIAAELKAAKMPDRFEREIAQACVNFDLIDVAVFPMMDSADVQDLITVDTLRLSPEDTRLWKKPPTLKSLGMGAFAGFFDKHARQYDIAVGRLNGAERLVDLILMAAFGELKGEGNAALRAKRDGLRQKYARALAEEILAESAKTWPDIAKDLEPLQAQLHPKRFSAAATAD